MDGKQTNLSENDIARRNTIAKLLSDWGLVNIKGTTDVTAPLSQIKIISFKEKDDWTLETKYNIGKKREAQGEDNESLYRTPNVRCVESKV